MNTTKTESILHRVQKVLAVTAASYGPNLRAHAYRSGRSRAAIPQGERRASATRGLMIA